MEKFSEKSLLALGDYYVYGLIDPRNNKFFYIGKGTGNRIFEHEGDSQKNPDSEKMKLKTIADIRADGLEVLKVIINSNLTEDEAFAAEAALINALNFVDEAEEFYLYKSISALKLNQSAQNPVTYLNM